jgi:hypothetical protein
MRQSSNHAVRDLVAHADRARRARAADRALAAFAPWCAGAVLLFAVAARLLGWSRWAGLWALAVAIAGLAAVTWLQRRHRPTTDAIAAAVDSDAALRGELRSAHWFENEPAQPETGPWVDFHVTRAVERASGVDWSGLYPSIKATRQWAVAAVASLIGIFMAVRMPVRANENAIARAIGDPEIAAALPPDLAAKLAALMEQLEKAALNKDAEKISLEEMKKLMANLDPALQKKLMELLEKKALGDQANQKRKDLDADERAERAENASAGLPEDVKWALDDMAARMAQQSMDRQTNPNNPSASSETAEKGMGSQQAEQKMAAMSEAASPLVREAATDAAAKMMMGGGGPMGGDSRPGAGGGDKPGQGPGAGLFLQALKKEMLEANADALGENIDKEDRRKKTEQGKSTLGYTRVVPPAAFEPSRSAAPPPVPEARRQLLLNYFIRKK